MRLGVLDIGSNTVHLLLVDAHPRARPIPFTSHKRPLQLHDLAPWATRLSAMASADRAELPGVSTVRSHQMLAAALVAQEAMEGLRVDSVQICPWALREGLILRRFDHLMAT